ncbi:putative glucose-6-phosphate 1-epimerase [Drosera capensis]
MASSSNPNDPIKPVEFTKGVNGLDKIILREVRGSSAEVYLYGGHVTSWKNDHGEELLFVSSHDTCYLVQAVFKPPKSIRGGIPICFPQFSGHGSLEQHGFARNRLWSVDPDPPPFPKATSNKAYVDLLLKPSEEELKIWPHSFEFRLRITLGPGGDLMLTSRIRNCNPDGKPFSFTFAYHTYFSVSDISEVRVEGLETLDYLDNLLNKERITEQGDAITFESEVDKIYLSTPTKIAIIDHERKRTFVIRKDGLPDAGEIQDILMLSGIRGIRRQKLWLISGMMSISTCFVWKLPALRSQSQLGLVKSGGEDRNYLRFLPVTAVGSLIPTLSSAVVDYCGNLAYYVQICSLRALSHIEAGAWHWQACKFFFSLFPFRLHLVECSIAPI